MKRARHLSLAILLGVIGVVSLGTPSAAVAAEGDADRRAAKTLHDRALKDYRLGRFQQAIDGFTKAYDLVNEPVLLYNIAQCHRQADTPERAIFFYRRYLEVAPRAENRAEVERKTAELEKMMASRVATPAGGTPPAGGAPPARDGIAAARAMPDAQASAPPAGPESLGPSSEQSRVGGAIALQATAPERSRRVALGLDAGPSLLQFGLVDEGAGWEEPKPGIVRGGAHFAVVDGSLRVAVGLSASLSPVQYWVQRPQGGKVTSLLSGGLIEGQVSALVARNLRIGGELGAGALVWTGLGDANPFTKDRSAPGKPVVLPTARLGAIVELALGRRITARMSPGFTIARAQGSALGALSRLQRFELLFGMGALL